MNAESAGGTYPVYHATTTPMGAYTCASDVSSFDGGPVFTLPEADYTIENPGDNVSLSYVGIRGRRFGSFIATHVVIICSSLHLIPRTAPNDPSGFGEPAIRGSMHPRYHSRSI